MTDEQLKAIEERAEKATPGSWVAMHYGPEVAKHPGWYVDCNPPDVLQVAMINHGYGGNGEAEANANFIADARDSVPALCAEVRRLQELLADREEWLERFQQDSERYQMGVEDERARTFRQIAREEEAVHLRNSPAAVRNEGMLVLLRLRESLVPAPTWSPGDPLPDVTTEV